MTCEELKELYELYALGAVDPAERRELEEHLERQCPSCQDGVRRARQVGAMLALAAPQVEPPARLRNRVVRSVAPAEKSGGVNWLAHAWATLALAMLAAVFWYVSVERKLEARISALDRQIGEAKTANAELVVSNRRLGDALALINLPDARQLGFGQAPGEPPRGRIWVHRDRGVVLLASNLPPAPVGKAYEMWVVPKVGDAIPAGVFHSDPQGVAMHLWRQQVDVGATAAIAVTLEMEGGVAKPTPPLLIIAKL